MENFEKGGMDGVGFSSKIKEGWRKFPTPLFKSYLSQHLSAIAELVQMLYQILNLIISKDALPWRHEC